MQKIIFKIYIGSINFPFSVETTTEPVPTDGCIITMPIDIPNPEPVYIVGLNSSYELFWPEGRYTSIPEGADLIVYCAGNDNTIVNLNQQQLTLKCRETRDFYSYEQNRSYNLTELVCSKIPNSELLVTSKKCSDNQGNVLEAGFGITIEGVQKFLSTFKICYDNQTEHTLYASNIINGATQNCKLNH